MTVRSEHQAFIRFASADLASNDPVDTDVARVIRNNLHHALDSFGQVLVAWSTPSFDTGGTVVENVYTGSSGANIDRHMWTSPYFYVRLDERGVPFPVRVAAHGGSAGGIAGIIYRVALTTTDNALQWLADAQADQPVGVSGAPSASYTNVAHADSATTPAWLDLDPIMLTLPAERARGATVRVQVPTLKTIAGDPVTVDAVRCRLTVWTGGTTARLLAMYAAEYCGGA